MSPEFLKLPRLEVVPAHQHPSSDFEKLSTDGYLIKKGLIDGALIDAIDAWTRWRFDQPDMHGATRIQDAFKESAEVLALAAEPAVLSLLETLYERRPIPFQTLNFKVGTQQRTHSDVIHFHCLPQRWMCGVWVAMEPVSLASGPLHYYPGSHRLPTLDVHDTSAQQSNYSQYENAIQELVETACLQRQVFLAEKGDCLIWAANLLHGGDPILDPSLTRVSQVSHYYFEGCEYYTPLLSDLSAKNPCIMYRQNLLDISSLQ